tara:strand:+ start:541 stop:789 length:249 start_codon:yes stop_codon:yes gene_type:complete
MMVETKFTIITIVTVKRFKLSDQSIFKLPEDIQFVIIKLLSPSKWKKSNDIIDAIVEQTIKAHETKFRIFSLTRLFKKIQTM